MDSKRFDDATRRLAAGHLSRRRALRGLAGVALAAVLGRAAPQSAGATHCKANPEKCKRDGQCCTNFCRKKRKRDEFGKCACKTTYVCGGATPVCGYDDFDVPCVCDLTTTGRVVCSNGDSYCPPDGTCGTCPTGTVCVTGSCCSGGFACAVACGAAPPPAAASLNAVDRRR